MTEGLFESPRGVFGNVLIERARQGARSEDALDGGKVARAERCGMTERAIDLIGGVALPQQQDLAGLCAPDPRGTQTHQPKEFRRMMADVAERDVDLIEIDRALALWRGV